MVLLGVVLAASFRASWLQQRTRRRFWAMFFLDQSCRIFWRILSDFFGHQPVSQECWASYFWVSRRFRSFVRNQHGSPFWFFRPFVFPPLPPFREAFLQGWNWRGAGALIREGCWDPERSYRSYRSWKPGLGSGICFWFRVFSSHLFGVYADLCLWVGENERKREKQHVSTGLRTKNRQDDDATDLLRSNARGLRVLVSTPPFLHIPLWNRQSRWS